MSLFDRAVQMIRIGRTNKEVYEDLGLVAFEWVCDLRTNMRRFDPDTIKESDARENRLTRITKGDTPQEHVRLRLLQGRSNPEIQKELAEMFPAMPMSYAAIAQERSRRRRKGDAVPRSTSCSA